MRVLLDTHTAIWAVSAADRLPTRIVTQIKDAEERYISLCSVWEIAIKSAPGRRSTAPMSVQDALFEFDSAGFELLDIRLSHIMAFAGLSMNHGDPFDRLILAQALSEPLHLITKDRKLAGVSEVVISW
ncbi:type II toxin-antitoxin system VapC family toxin [Allomesorhizobium camelthorni]|uniref:Type II toxin-antitoxin system VapC family toxin n=1 Tax=Allomesorhizobium camelthorni TaxID=475069 RepID=A0A6G4W938_9HYPH|nr:type II toxin-antitoxin system VapC family toxin [Mesorhizobium camelthorni]NGO51281.1 type II toxin-antitoxin system VapC family toxin [Mesorhizobium camelthorni]